MKKFIKLTLVLLVLLAMTACKTGTGGGNNKPPVVEDPAGTIFSPNVHIAVVKADDGDDGFSAEVQILISKLTGMQPTLVVPGAVKAENEIVIGYCEREIAKKAQAELDAMLAEGNDAGWVIYAEGGSLAIVYSGDEAMSFAFEYFKNNYLSEPTLAYATAHVASDSFLLDAYYRELELADYQKQFDTLAENHGEELVAAIKSLYALYGSEVFDWLANLYDPETGGFYYSPSARDTYGYAPDVKSTADVIILLEYSGIASKDGGLRRALNNDVKSAISGFIRGRQVNGGFFYNTDLQSFTSTDRRNADLAAAVAAMGIMNVRLKHRSYDTYAAILGGSLFITAPVAEKSDVIAVDGILDDLLDNLIPERYQSTEALYAYLDSLNVMEDTEAALTAIANDWTAIILAQRAEDVYAYFESLRNAETGLYGDGKDMAALRKYVTIAQTLLYGGGALTATDKVTATAISIALSTEESENITDAATVWYVLSLTVGNPANDGSADAIRATVAENRVALIAKTAAILAEYKKADGSFSYYKTQNLAQPYGLDFAVPGVDEGDVSSTAIAIGYIPHLIFTVLELGDMISPYLSYELNGFTDKLLTAEPIVKSESVDLDITYDFEDDTVGEAPIGLATVLNSPEPGHITVAEADGKKYVEMQSVKGDGYGDSILVRAAPGTDGNGLVFEADFCIVSSSENYFTQITLGDAYIISFTAHNGFLQIHDRSDYSGPDYSTLFATDVPIGEWFNLRIEYYCVDGDTRSKVTINGEKFRISNNYYGKVNPDKPVEGEADTTEEIEPSRPKTPGNTARIYLLHAAETVMLVDNISYTRADAPLGLFDIVVEEEQPSN